LYHHEITYWVADSVLNLLREPGFLATFFGLLF
jgi:hypothetical protein